MKKVFNFAYLLAKRILIKTKRFISTYVQKAAKWFFPFRLNLYIRFRNSLSKILQKPRIFIYTDSRGQFVTHQYLYRRGVFPFYAIPLLKDYYVEYHTCPERHTTTMDFIQTYEASRRDFDFVIAHIGIVDFSPRHQKTAFEVYKLKKFWYDTIFSEDEMIAHISSDLGVMYEGDKTINMFSLEMAKFSLIPYLKKIQNLIFIGCNNFVPDWDGNYWRERPKNIRLVEDYSSVFCAELDNCVDLSDWTNEDVQRYTVDNIHFTPKGGEDIYKRIRQVICEMERSKGKDEI